ncbi:MAG: DUF11 domain-containing protein [Lewinellaceae bacterium]|nr:DUF11 domain-containing protein [Lewinellaceae bacterium]
MRGRYTAFIEKTVAKIFAHPSLFPGFVSLIFWIGNPFLANAQCTIRIQSVNVDCSFDNGSNVFAAEVAVRWSSAPGSSIQVNVGGQSQLFTPSAASGVHTFSGFTLPSPGYGYPVTARFTGPGACEDFSTADAVACTPPCLATPTTIGGMAWKENVADGLFDGEPGQPNIKIEVYDCEEQLRGTAFTNADGQWSVTGLNAGEEYRVEFSTQQVPGINPSLAGPDNGSPVQFVMAGDCSVNAAFMEQSARYCSNPDNPTSLDCSGAPNVLDWRAFTNGANPFPAPPFVAQVNQDEVFWARTLDGATPYAHRVYHSSYGGADAYYLLEMDAGVPAAAAGGGMGVVFAFSRPVAELSFSLLDIDLAGNAIDRVSVQGYLGGVPVSLSLADIAAGSAVSVLEPYLFEGTSPVDDASDAGNVTIRFGQPVDQLAITLSSVSPEDGGGVQGIGIGNISWCAEPASLEPECVRIFDWMAFPDNNDPTPYSIDGVALDVQKNDPFGIASGSAFLSDNDFSPQGGQRGFWAIGMDAAAQGQYVENIITFSQPVSQLAFSILDIDESGGQGVASLSYQDRVTVHGFLGGEEIPAGLSDITAGSGVLGGSFDIASPNEYSGNGLTANGASADGNLALQFPGDVDSVVIRLYAGPDGPANPGVQQIGLSDLNFCICRPAPLQIGDFVWEDENGNGIQEACELPLPNLPVALYDEAGTLLATTQSDTAGRYHFTRPDTPGEDWLAGDGLQPNTPYFIVFGNDAANPDDRFLLVNDILYVPTGRHAGNGANPYMNDSDPDPDALSAGMPGDIPDGLPYVSFSTGDIGQGNPTLDAGFIPARFDLALRMVLNEELTPPPFYPGDIVNYSITVFNQGMVPTSLLTLVDYYPDEAMELVDDGIWFYENGVTYTRWPLPNIGPGDSLSLNISLRIKASNPLDTIINRTEVYHGGNSFNLPDVDSTPDGQPDNDAGGAPGSEADNAINGDGTGPVNGTEAATDEDDHDVEQIAVLGITPFDLALDLSLIGDGPFYSGDDVTFSIEVVNEGALEATMVQLNSYIPNGFTLNDPAWVVSGSAAQLSTPIDVLPSGTSVFREVTFRIDQSFVGDTITQTVEIADATNAMGESDADSTPNNQQPSEDDQASAKIGVNPVFDLSLEKRVVNPGPYYPGDQVTFTIRVTNEGNVPAQDVQIIDFVPYGLTLNHNSWSYSTNNIVRINNAIPNIAPGNTVTRQITFTIADDFPGTSITNYAEIFFATNQPGLADRDSNPGNFSDQEDDDDTATIGIWQPGTVFDLALKKEINYQMTPGPFEPGDYISFNITVTNEGNMAANGIQVLDQLPAGTTLEDNGWNLSGSMALSGSPISNLWPGESATLTIRLRINDDFDGDELINRAEVFSAFNSLGVNDIDSTPGNGVDAGEDDEGIAVVPVEQPLPAFDLSLVKKVKTSETPGPFYPGSTVTFSIRVSNEGNIDAESVSVIDYIPPGLILADDNWSQVFGSAVLSEPITGLAAGESATVDITFTISDDFTGQLIANVAEVNSATNSLSMPDEDSTPANAQDTEDDIGKSRIVVVQTYDLALSKTLNTSLTPAPYQPGGQVAFNLTVYNQGSLAANNITLYDYYPPGLQLNDSNWQAIQGNILRLANPIPVLEPGQSATVTILFDITNDVMNGDSLVNCAELGASTNINGLPDADSTPSNGSHDEDDDDTETILISIPKRFDLALSKSVDTILTPGPYYPGSTVAYNITVKNEGEEVAQGIQVQDYIPQGLILTSQDWSALGSIATLNSPVTSLLPGDSTTLNITFTISPVFQGASLTNYAEIAGSNANSNLSDADSTPGNGSAGAGEDDYDGATIAVTRQDFDLALRKRLKSSETPGPFVPGSTVTFEIEVSNEGDLTAQNIQLREYFPSGLLLTDPDWNAVGNVAELAFPIPSLAPGAITVVDVSFTVAPGFSGSNLTNFAEVGSAFNILGYDDMDSTPGNGSLGPNEDDYDDASITVIQQEFDLALSKELKTSATPGPFFPGSNVTYSITITNEGDLEAQNVQLRDYIPLGLVLADNNWTLNGSMAVRSTGSLQPGASATYDISFTISDAFSGLVLANYAEVGSAANTMGIQDKDSTPGNGSAAPNEDDYDSASITVIQDEFDLSLTKELNTSLTPGPFVPGSSVTFRITVTNEGGLAAQNIQVRDYIPLGLVLADNNWTLNGSMAVRNIASLQPGASIVLNISFTISPSFGGQLLNNSAEVGAASNSYGLGDRDSTPGNGPAGPNEDDYDSASITVIQDEFDLSLTKELNTSLTPGPFVPGSTVTFRITVANEGDLAAQNVQVLDYIPLGLILTDNNWSSNGNLASRAISNLAPGSSTTLNITFTVASNFSGTAIANYAEVGSANNIYGLDDRDSTPGNGSSGAGEDDFDGASISVVQQPFDLALSKELNTSLTPGPFYPGSTVTFQVTVTNEGGISAQNIQVRDYIPLGLVLADNDWTLNGSMAYTNIGALQPGESASVDITFTISPNFTGFFITNFAEIGAAGNAIGLGDTDSTPGNGSAGAGEDDFDSAGITVNPPQQFDLTLSKTVSSSTPGPYYAGSPVTFKLTVTNQGNVAAQSIQLWDYLPPALTLSDAGWTQNGGVASYNTPIASLAPGASVTVEIDFVVSAGFGGTSTVNYAEISGAFNGSGLSDEDSTPGNGSSGANEDDYDGAAISISVVPQFDLALSKTVSTSTPGPYYAGSPVTFKLTVTNQGNVAAQSIQLWDYLPPALTLSDAGWTQNGGVASYNTPIASLAPGASVTVEIDFVVSAGFGGTSTVNYAEISGAFNGSGLSDEDSTPGNGSSGANEDDYDGAAISISVVPQFDLALSKTVSTSTPGPYYAGSPVTFKLTVTNQGNVAAQSIQLWDYLPPALTLSDAGWTQNGGVASYNTPIASLAPGASVTVEIDFVVSAGFGGTSTVNYAEISGAFNGSGLSDEDSTPGNGSSGANEDDYDGAAINISVTPQFDLALRKQLKASATPGPFSPGSPVIFRITVVNQGNMDAYNVEIADYIPAGLVLTDGNWTQSGSMATRTIPGPILPGGTATADISFVIDQNFVGNTIMNYAEIMSADDDNDAGNGAPVDIDSQYDTNPDNDAGGLAGSPSDDAINGDGSGQPGSSQASTDEDDQDPALIVVGNCPDAGTDGFVEVCLTCTSDDVFVDLTAALGGSPSPGGAWTDLDGSGVSLADPSNVNFMGLPGGDYQFEYSVGGQNGCPILSATVVVSLSTSLDNGCNSQINVPVGNNSCEVLVTPSMVLSGSSNTCTEGLTVNLLDPNGVSLGNTFTADMAGQTLIAEVLDPNCGLVCWGYVYVQDFTPPAISCPVQDIDLVCSDLDSILNNPASLAITGMPEIYDTCVQHTVTFQDQEVMTPDCVSRQINRVFTVTDPMGNSVQCTQVITARNPTFADLLPLPSQLEIPCDSNFVQDQNGNPDPSVTGYPMVQAYFGAHPLNQAYCTLGASYTDSPPIDVCEGTIRIIRHWEILDWCENSPNSILELTQFITVGDVAGPEVSCPEIDFNGDGYPDPLNFSTSSYDCTATFQAPLPIVTDNCSSWEVRTDIISDEVVPVTNQFGIITGYDTVATIIATILPGEPRLVSDIPVGCYRFSYKVTDDCNNYTQLECDFCVVDNVQPTAICDDALTVSLGGLGLGRVYAEAVNESSTDNCGIDTMLVRRLYEADPLTCDSVSSFYSDWAPYVDFSCCDVSQLATVELLVIDGAGNQNTCWMEVLVEDKVLPDCYAPNDTTVSCSSLPDNFDPNDTGQLQALFGAATAEDACGGAYVVEQAPLVNLDQCNAGTITRAFQAVDLSGNLSQSLCVQVITITSEYNYEIKFPKDFTTNCTVPTPDTLIYTSFGCDMLSVSVTDEVFTPLSGSPGPECYKIFRKYRVLNWCEYDGLSDAVVIGRNEDCDGVPGDEDVWVVRYPNGAWIDRDNDPSNNIPAFGAKGVSCDGTTNPTGFWRSSTSVGLWEYTQIIKVIDTIPPEINFTAPGAFCSYDGDSCLGQVQYPFTVTDDCSATGLTLEVFLDANADGTIDEDLTNAGVLSGTQPNFSIQGDFPIGSHAFIIQASDGCGNNPASATLPFEVVDCQPPAFTCYSGLSFGLSSLPPNTDLDGDGINDAAGAAVWASDLILNASDCSDDTIAYSINLAGEAPDIGQQVLYFTCEDTGTIAVQVYVWDSAYNPYAVQPDGSVGGPNYSICDTYVTIQDSTACNGGLLGPMMAGLIAREDNMGVENVEVSLSGPQSLMMLSEVDGTYQFDNLDTGYDYTLSPYLNTDHRNGISTFDLLIIQQHLLGVQPLDSPYKRIAADANHSGNITTLDMIQIQQLILGEILEFPNNTSWRFVDKAFVFPVPTNPWFTPFPEVISVNNLSYPMMANDFVAIKIGDVNNSAVTTGLMGVDGRSFDGTFYLEAPQLELKKGEVAAVPFSARELEAIRGCQFTLDFDPGRVELTDVEYGLADENSIGFHGLADGFLTVSWYRKGGVSYPEGEPLFTLFFRAKENTNLKDLLSISSRYTLAEAYTPGQELLDVALRFGSGRQEEEGGVFRLYQNRPNPFSEESAIGFELPESGAATLSVFDLNGRLLYRKQDLFDKGYNELILKREGLRHLSGAGGVLYYKLQMGNRVATRKMIILE